MKLVHGVISVKIINYGNGKRKLNTGSVKAKMMYGWKCEILKICHIWQYSYTMSPDYLFNEEE